MAPGNFTLPSSILKNCDGFSGFFYCFSRWSNLVTGGLFWFMLLIGFVIVIFMGSLRFGVNRAFGFASTVGLLAAMWLATIDLIQWNIASGFIILGVIGLAVMLLSDN